jgi:hypothetical protein
MDAEDQINSLNTRLQLEVVIILACPPWHGHLRALYSSMACHVATVKGPNSASALMCRADRDYKVIARFGEKYRKKGKTYQGRQPVHLLYTGGNHFDLLEP